MKLIKKLLIPGVALSVLFGFSYGLEANFGYINIYETYNRDDYCTFVSSGYYLCDFPINNFDISKSNISGFDVSKYSILSFNNSNKSDCAIIFQNRPAPSLRYEFYCSINNNKFSFNSGNILHIYCGVSGNSSKACPDTPLVLNYRFRGLINYVLNTPFYVDGTGSFGIGNSISSGISSNVFVGSNSIVKLLIQILPWMIFLFIIGYIIRKILIRFGMLKSPGVALNSKTYNKGKK